MENNNKDNLTILKVSQPTLTSIHATETERGKYAEAYGEFNAGILSPSDYLTPSGEMYGVGKPVGVDGGVKRVGEIDGTEEYGQFVPIVVRTLQRGGGQANIGGVDGELTGEPLMTYDEMIKAGKPASDNREYMEWVANNALPNMKRQREIAEKWGSYKSGHTTYEEFLLGAYGRDALKAMGHHTDSIAYWKSQFREGNYQHPLDNELIKASILQQAESLFKLESFYESMSTERDMHGLADYVGKELDEEGYRKFFGEDWTSLVERVGDYEKAVRFFKAGYLGDAVNTLIYKEYNDEGQGVGDPVYWVNNTGVVFELVENNGQKIDKSRQMYLVKNSDGSFDRLTAYKNEWGEFFAAIGKGFVGGLTGVADLIGMAVFGVTSIWDQDSDEDYKDSFLRQYTDFTNWMNNNLRDPLLKVHDLDNEAWDSSNIARGAGSAIGFVLEILVEIALTQAGTILIQASKQGGTKVATTVVVEGAEAIGKKAAEEIAKESISFVVEEGLTKIAADQVDNVVGNIVGNLVKDLGEDAVKKIGLDVVGKETMEGATEAVAKIVRESVEKMGREAIIKEVGEKLAITGIERAVIESTIISGIKGRAVEEVVKQGAFRSVGRGFQRFIGEGLSGTMKLSNQMKMLNSGSLTIANKFFSRIIKNPKWSSTIARATMNMALTTLETSVNQMARAQYDTELTGDIIARNAFFAGAVAFASTALLSSSLQDVDNTQRFSKEGPQDHIAYAFTLAKLQLQKQGDAVTDAAVENLAREMINKSNLVTEAAFNKFNLGRYMNKQRNLRIIGGVSELVDNVITAGVRNAANAGAKTWTGEGGLLHAKNFLSPDVILPAALSASQSFIGKRGILGFGENEGSFNSGVAAMKRDVVLMYTDLTTNILDKLIAASEGTAEHEALLNVRIELGKKFEASLKSHGDMALAALDVLEELHKTTGGAVDALSPFEDLDRNVIRKLTQTDAFKKAVKDGMFNSADDKRIGFVKNGKFNENFSLMDYVGLTKKSWDIDKSLAYQRKVISIFEERKMRLDEVMSRTATGMFKGFKKNVGSVMRTFFSPTHITELSENKQLAPLIMTLGRITGNFDAKQIDDLMEAYFVNTENDIAFYEDKLENEVVFRKANELITRFTSSGNPIIDAQIIGAAVHQEIIDFIKITQDVGDAQASEILSRYYAISAGDPGKKKRQEKVAEFGKELNTKISQKLNEIKIRETNKLKQHNLDAEEIQKIINNAMRSTDLPEGQLANLHLKNGLVINLTGNEDEEKPLMNFAEDSEERRYLEAVRLVSEMIIATTDEDTTKTPGAYDFVVLDKEKGRIFLAIPTDEITDTTMLTMVRLRKLISNVMILQTKKDIKPDVLFAALANTSAVLGINTKLYYTEGQAFDAVVKKSERADRFISTTNFLLEKGIVSADIVYRALFDSGAVTDDFKISVIKMITQNNISESPLGRLTTLQQNIIDYNNAVGSEMNQATIGKLLHVVDTFLNEGVGSIEQIKKDFPDLDKVLDLDGITKQVKEIKKQFDEAGIKSGSDFPQTQVMLEKLQKLFAGSSVQSMDATERENKIIEYLRKEEGNKAASEIKTRAEMVKSEREKSKTSADQLIDRMNGLLESPDFQQKLLNDEVPIEQILEEIREVVRTNPNARTNSEIFRILSKPKIEQGDLEAFVMALGFSRKKQISNLGQLIVDKVNDTLVPNDDGTITAGMLFAKVFNAMLDEANENVSVAEGEFKEHSIRQRVYQSSKREKITDELKFDDYKYAAMEKVLRAFMGKITFEENLGPLAKNKSIVYAVETSKELEPFRESIKKHLNINDSNLYDKEIMERIESKGYEDFNAFIDDITKRIENGEIRTDYENKAIHIDNLMTKLYVKSVPYPPEVTRIRINLGELRAAVYNRMLRRARVLNNSQTYGLAPNDTELLLNGIYNVEKYMSGLLELQKYNAKTPIIEYDLTDQTQRDKFNYLMINRLGFTEDELYNASQNATHKIAGVTFNNDTLAIKGKKGQGKAYKNINELYKAEMQGLVFKTTSVNNFLPKTMEEILLSVLPYGIIGIDENTKLRVVDAATFKPGQKFTNEHSSLIIEQIASEETSLDKAGKAGAQADATFGFTYNTVGIKFDNDEQFVNFVLLRHFVDQMDKIKDQLNNQINFFKIPEDRKPEEINAYRNSLSRFGWEFNEDAQEKNKLLITGFNKDKALEFFSTNEEENFNIFNYIPVQKAKDGKIYLGSPTAGGGNFATVEKHFFELLVSLNEKMDKDGSIKILTKINDRPIEITAELAEKSFEQLIAMFENSNNFTERTFAVSLKAAIAASKHYDNFLTEHYGDIKESVKKVGQLVNDKNVLRMLFDPNIEDEERSKKINEYLVAKSEELKGKPIPKGTIEPTYGDDAIPIRKNYVFSSQIDYSKYEFESNWLTDDDLLAIKKMYATPFIEEQAYQLNSTEYSLKNKFLAMVYEGEDGYYIPLSNLIKITSSDFNEEIMEGVKFGAWIEDTFGQEFYNDIKETINTYDEMYPSRTVKSLLPDNFIYTRDTAASPSMQMNTQTLMGNFGVARNLGEAKLKNKLTLNERAQMENDRISAADIGTQARSALSNSFIDQAANIDDMTINPTDTTARTQVTNANNKLAVAKRNENAFVLYDEIKNNRIENIPQLNEEDAVQLTKHIITIATIDSTEKRKSSFIIGTKDANGNTTFETIVSDQTRPYDSLLNKLTEIKAKGDPNLEVFLIQVEDGSTLRRAGEDNPIIQTAYLHGPNQKPNPEITMDALFDTLFLETWYRNDPELASLSNQELAERYVEDVSHRFRIQETKNIYIKSLKDRLLQQGLSPQYTDMLINAFKKKTYEVDWTTGGGSMVSTAVENAFSQRDSDVFDIKKRNSSIARLQSIVFDGIDTGKEDAVREVLDSMLDQYEHDIKQKKLLDPEYETKINEAVQSIKSGLRDKMPYFGSGKDIDYEGIAQVIRKYSLTSGNTALEKFALLSINDNNPIQTMNIERNEKTRNFEVIITEGTKKSKVHLNKVMKDPNAVRVFFDAEWSFTNEEVATGRKVYQLSFVVKDGVGEQAKESRLNLFVKQDQNFIDMVVSEGGSTEYGEFNKWLSKEKKTDTFIRLATKADAKSNDAVGAEALRFLEGVVNKANKEKKNVYFFSHNGKGENSDLETIANSFNFVSQDKKINIDVGTKIIDLISGKTNKTVTHIDFYNDVVKNNFVDDHGHNALENKKRLETLFNNLPNEEKDKLKTSFGAHDAREDAEMLEIVVDNFEKFVNSGALADTKSLDYINDIFKSIVGRDLTRDDMIGLEEHLKYKFDNERDIEFEEIISKWKTNHEKVKTEIKKEMIEMYEYFQKKIESVRQSKEISGMINKVVDYKADEIREFVNGLTIEGSNKFRKSINALYDVFFIAGKEGDINAKQENEKEFLSTLTDAIGKAYGVIPEMINSSNEFDDPYYNEDAFRNFYSAIQRDPVEAINKIIKQINSNQFRTNKKAEITQDYFDSVSFPMDSDATHSLLHNGKILKDHEFNKTIRPIILKTSDLVNNLVNQIDISGDSKNELINEMFRLVSVIRDDDSEYGYTDYESLLTNLKNQSKILGFKGNSIAEYLKQMALEGFQDNVSSFGLYRRAHQSTEAQALAAGELDQNGNPITVGRIFGNKVFIKDLLGMTLDKYKEIHDIENVYVSLKRDPSDKFDTLHAYKLVEDKLEENNKDNSGSYMSMNKMELFSKHSGDFDGDSITIYLPDKAMQIFYNDGEIFNALNDPYIKANAFMKKVHEWAQKNYKGKSIEDLEITNFETQERIAKYLRNPKHVEELFDAIKKGDAAYTLFVSEMVKTFGIDTFEPFKNRFGKLNDDQKLKEIIDFAKGNLLFKLDMTEGYFLNNKYLTDKKTGKLNSYIFASKYQDEANALQFRTSINMIDQLTGMYQKDEMARNLIGTEMPRYNPFKFEKGEMELIAAYLKDIYNYDPDNGTVRFANKKDAMNQLYADMTELGLNSKAVQMANDTNVNSLYTMFLVHEAISRYGKDFNKLISDKQKALFEANKDGTLKATFVEDSMRRIAAMQKAYKEIMPQDFLGGRLNQKRKLSLESTRTIVELLNDIDLVSGAKERTQFISGQEALGKHFTKEVTVLVDTKNKYLNLKDKDGSIISYNEGINNDGFIPTKKFVDETFLYHTVSYNLLEKDRVAKPSAGSELVSSKRYGNHILEVYRAKIDNDVKFMSPDNNRFGKLVPLNMVESDSAYQNYDMIISGDHLNRAELSKSPNVDITFVETKVIDGIEYEVIKFKTGIAENTSTWNKALAERSIDILTLAMNANSIGFIPFANGVVAEFDSKTQQIIPDLELMQNVFNFRQKRYAKDLHEANFMGSYNKLRGLIAVDYILKNHSKDENIVNTFLGYKARLEAKNQNWSIDTGTINDIIRYAQKVSNGEFLQAISTDKSGFKKRLFSKRLYNLAIHSTFPLLEMTDRIEELQAEKNYQKVKKETAFSGKGSAQDKIFSDFDYELIGASNVGIPQEAMAGGKILSYLHMPAVQAINYLLKGNTFLSNDDVVNAVRHGIFNVGQAVRPSIATGFVALDENNVILDTSDKVNPLDRNYNNKSGTTGPIAEAPNVQLGHGFESSFGVPKVRENDGTFYLDGSVPRTDKLFKDYANYNADGTIKEGKESVNYKKIGNTRNGNFINHLHASMDYDSSVEDRMLRFAGKKFIEFQTTGGGTNLVLEDGEIKNKAQLAAIKSGKVSEYGEPSEIGSVRDLRRGVNESYNFGAYYRVKDFLEARNQELLQGDILDGLDRETMDFEVSEQKKKLSKVEQELQKKKDEYLIKTINDQNKFELVAEALLGENKEAARSQKSKLYDTEINYADIEKTQIAKDLLDPVGLKTVDAGSAIAKNGIDRFFIGSKSLQIDWTSPLQAIKMMVGNDVIAAEQFDEFTKMRYLQLSYKEAHASKDKLSIELANQKLQELGFGTIQEMENKMRNYMKLNVGVAQMYDQAIDKLVVAANQAAKALNITDNIDELFVLQPFIKRGKNSSARKNQYFNTLNSVFLNKRASLNEMIIKATEYNFSESMYYMASNLAKVVAMEDAKNFFKKAGVLENESIYRIAQDTFEKELEKLDGSESRLTAFEKEEIIDAINHTEDGVLINIKESSADSKLFFLEVYNDIIRAKGEASYGTPYRNMTIPELKKAYNETDNHSEQQVIKTLLRLEKTRVDFMADTIKLNKNIGKEISKNVKAIATNNNGVLTNEYMQMLPSDGRSSFSFLTGFDFKTLRDSYDFITSGDTDDDRIAYMAVSGNLFRTNKKLADHMDKYFFTEKVPTRVEEILNKVKGTYTSFIMSMPHKLLPRVTEYSIGDIAQLSATDPTIMVKMIPSLKEMRAFYQSKGATLEAGSDLHIFLESVGFNPFSYQNKSLSLDTLEYDNSANLGKGYFDVAEKAFTFQTLAGRYALWKSVYNRFEEYDKTGVDKRLYGPVYSERKYIDAMESNADKARYITYASLGGPNGFALIARKELKTVGMFMTFPMALARTGIGHLKSVQSAFNEVVDGTATNATRRYLGSASAGIAGAAALSSLFIAAISSFFNVDKETEEEWKKKATYIDPFLTLLNDRPMPSGGGKVGLYGLLREMFYEPFEEADGNLLKGSFNWLSANVIGKLNPMFKIPIELATNKEFMGSGGPTDTYARNFYDNVGRKAFSAVIGASGAAAMSDQWYYTELGNEDPGFIKKLGISLSVAIKAEAGNYRGYKNELKNYYKALSLVRGYRALENADVNTFGFADNGYNGDQMYKLSSDIKRAMDKKQPPSVIYGLIDEAIKDGASASTIKAALFNNSISGKMSQVKDVSKFISTLGDRDKIVLEDAIKYEEQNYSILKTIVNEYLKNASGRNDYQERIYVPKNYYTYPQYNGNKYGNNYYRYQNSWFNDKKWNNYAKNFFKYHAKKNFVPSLTYLTGKYAKDFYDYKEPYRVKGGGNVQTKRYNKYKDEDDDAIKIRSKVNERD